MPIKHVKGLTAAQIIVGTDWQKTSPSPSPGAGGYTEIPTLAQWKNDSSAIGDARSRDKVLTRIDTLVQAIAQAPNSGSKTYLTADLYFALVVYLRQPESKKLNSAVEKLYRVVTFKLCVDFKCDLNILPRELEYWFGRELSFHGYTLDTATECAVYLSRADVKKYELHFRNGKVYQLSWRVKGLSEASGMVLADSNQDANLEVFNNALIASASRKGWAGFVMSQNRALYMARHFLGDGWGLKDHFYHSTYLGGDSVQCAGTMLIKKGVIKGIGIDSGHYQPTSQHVVNLLQALLAHGIDISGIEIQGYNGAVIASGVDFMNSNGNWESMLMRRQANLNFIATEHRERNKFENVIKTLWRRAVGSGSCTDDRAGRLYFAKSILPGGKYNYLTEEYISSVLAHGATPDTDAEWAFGAWIDYMTMNHLDDTWENRFHFADTLVARGVASQRRTVLLWLQEAYASKNLPTDTPANGPIPAALRRARPAASPFARRPVPPVPGSSIPSTLPPPPPGRPLPSVPGSSIPSALPPIPGSSIPTAAPPPPPRRPGPPTVARRSTLRPPDITRL